MLTIIQNDPKVNLSAYADYLAEMVGAYRTFHPYAGEALPPVAQADAVITLGLLTNNQRKERRGRVGNYRISIESGPIV